MEFFEQFYNIVVYSGQKAVDVRAKFPSPFTEITSWERLRKLAEMARGLYTPDLPIQAKEFKDSGGNLTDVLTVDQINGFLVSDKFVEVLKQNNFSGWGLHPIECTLKTGELLQGYHYLVITGKCGPIRFSENYVERFPPPRQKFIRQGLIFEPDSWDGSDIFMSTQFKALKMITKSLKEALEQAGITGPKFISLNELQDVGNSVDQIPETY